ncbi:MAG: universal stress protein [Acidimicrobiia bacterium]
MHVLVATAGALSPEPVVEFARHLIGGTGSVTVTTVVEVPRDFLEHLDADDWHPLHDAQPTTNTDEVVANYLAERGHRLTDPIKQALETARIPCEVKVLEGADAAEAISAAANDLAVDVVLLGATKRIFNVDAWESVSARVMQEAGRPVLVVPQARQDADDEQHVDSFQEAAEPTTSI